MTTPARANAPAPEPPTRRAGAFGLMRGAAASAGRARVGFVPSMSVLRDAAADAQRSRLPQMAAALAFRTIFGLIPMAVVALVALRAFATDEDIKNAVTQAMGFTGLNRIVIEEPAPPEELPWTWLGPSPFGPPELEPVAEVEPQEAATPDAGPPRLDSMIEELVGRASGLNVRVIGWIGIATLIYAAISMLIEVERAFNQIYRVPVGRSWVRRIMQYWTLLTLGSIFLVATFWVGEQFRQGVARVAAYSGADSQSAVIVGALAYGTTVAISTLLLVLAYMAVPNTKVKLPPALAGAFIAALLWEAGKWGFTQYLHHSTSYITLYGSLALIPLFLLWVYVTWVIVLFGLYVSYQIQHIRANTVAQPEAEAIPSVVDPLSILAVVAHLAQRFEDGRAATAAEVARQLNIASGVAAQMLDRLAASGVAHRLSTTDSKPAFALSRPPERIPAEEILRIGEQLAGQADAGAARPDGAAAVVLSLREARHDILRNRTVADLLGSADPAERTDTPGPAVPPPARPATPQAPVGPIPKPSGASL